MAWDPTIVYLTFAGIVVVALCIISFFFQDGKKTAKTETEDGAKERLQQVAKPRREGPRGQGTRRRQRMRVTQEGSDEDEEEADDVTQTFDAPEGKIGAKKALKLQAKAEKKQQREYELQEREEKKQREALLEKQRKKEEAKRKMEEEARAEEEKQRKEEEEKREHEEYLKLKECFIVEEEGECQENPDLDSQSLLQEFVNYIKEMKVVMLEDLAAHFKLRTQDVIDRVQELQEEGQLTGVMDDRGKFIYITMEELENVAKFIRQHGRVSIMELAESSNRLINLNPDNATIQKKLLTEIS
ncbi:hypothetical protein ScPMuIL_000162 [Solemya velum]